MGNKYSYDVLDAGWVYIIHSEDQTKTLIGICRTIEMAHFLVTAANNFYDRGVSEKERCHICGQPMVQIRGRYPGNDQRFACAACATERLENIQEISRPEYGRAFKNGTSDDPGSIDTKYNP